MADGFDAYLKITGVDGDSKDDKHPAWIQLASYSFGCHNAGTAGTGGGMGAGKVAMQDFSFTPQGDSGGPDLFLKCASGAHINEAKLEVQKAGGTKMVFFKVTFTDILLSSFNTAGAQGMTIPQNAVSFNFAKIKLEATAQNNDGSPGATKTTGWDVQAGVKM